VKSLLIGELDPTARNEPCMPFGLWQIDEVTGDLQFCMDRIEAGLAENCAMMKAP
jgi:hypothetical protein